MTLIMEAFMPTFQEIDIRRVKEMVDNKTANVVDIRDPGSYQSGHLPDAVAVNDGNVQQYTEAADKEKPLIVYCYHGISSQGAAAYFKEQGFKEVYSMTGGYEAWRSAYANEGP